MNDIQERLLAAFKTESNEHIEYIRNVLDTTSPQGLAGELLDEVFRRAHSLKGAARAVGLQQVETLSHHLETLFSQFRDGTRLPAQEHATLFVHTLDAIEDLITASLSGQSIPDTNSVKAELEHVLNLPSEPANIPSDIPLACPENSTAPPDTPSDIKTSHTLRVESRHLDALLEDTGQLQISAQRYTLFSQNLKSLNSQVHTLLKLTQHQNTINQPFIKQQIQELATRLHQMTLQHRQNSWQTSQQIDQLQHNVQQARQVSAGSVFDGFRKMMRDLAQETGKAINIQITGLQTIADRVVLQTLKDPLMHLLRNALSHGIETQQERAHKNKSSKGNIALHIENSGTRLLIRVEDDGQGIDAQKVLTTAQQKGLPSEREDTNELQALTNIIFQAGFSTRKQATHLSGRGMGLSIVSEAVKRLQGDISITKTDIHGTIFQITVPQTLTAHRLLLIICGKNKFAIPVHGIDRLYRIKPNGLQTVDGRLVFSHQDRTIPLTHLHDLLELQASPPPKYLAIVVLNGAGSKAAFIVDHFEQVRDAIIQDFSQDMPMSVAGGIALENGLPALVLNPAELVANAHSQTKNRKIDPINMESSPTKVPHILVVDDSITTRTLEKNILESQGYNVEVAVDGIQALEKLKTFTADLIVTDIEMPRLDGFGLVTKLKASTQLAHIPVIIVSSLQDQEDRQRGLQVGADAYVIKQKFDQQDLLNTIKRFV